MAIITPNKTKKETDGSKKHIYTVEKGEERTTLLIANFSGDKSPYGSRYAVGWKFKISSAFREALDIKYTTITVSGKVIKRWTQGIEYAFKIGDLIHSVDGNLSVQVDRATPQKRGVIEVTVNSNTTDSLNIVQKKKLMAKLDFFFSMEINKKTFTIVPRQNLSECS